MRSTADNDDTCPAATAVTSAPLCQAVGMELADAIRRRRMVRSDDPDRPVSRETVEQLLKLAVRAPSAGHPQGRRFLVLDDVGSRDRFWTATHDGPPDPWVQRLRQGAVVGVLFSDCP